MTKLPEPFKKSGQQIGPDGNNRVFFDAYTAEQMLKFRQDAIEAVQAERDTLRQQLAEAQALIEASRNQEPMAWIFTFQEHTQKLVSLIHPKHHYKNFIELTPLYAAPVVADDVQRDSERYRWLRNPETNLSMVIDKQTGWVPPDEHVEGVGGYYKYEYRSGEELDASIDAAMRSGELL